MGRALSYETADHASIALIASHKKFKNRKLLRGKNFFDYG